MGILGAFLLIFSGESRGKTLLSFESSIQGADLSSSDLRSAMRSLWRIYIGLTVITIIGLWILDMTLFQAINHGFTAASTGGFGTEDDSITSFSGGVKLWLSLSMLLCGISFPLYMALLKRKDINVLKRHEETRWYLIIIVIAIVIILISNYLWGGISSVLDVIFNVIAIATSTGFVVGDYEVWPVLSKQVIMLLMVVGGCSGSTAGGLKVSRMLLWIRSMKNEIIRGFRPNVVLKLQMNGKAVDDQVIRSVYVVTSVAVFFFLTGSMAIALLEPELDAITCASAVLSSICNIGPAFSELGPTQNYSVLSAPSLGVLSMLMILGRLEFIAVLVLLSRRLWRKY
jgi:trk system potassium uptake protein TrkH